MNEKVKSAITDQIVSSHLRDHSILHCLSHAARNPAVDSELSLSLNTVELASQFGLTPQHLLTRLQILQQYGIEFAVLDQTCCRLRQPLDLLDVDKILSEFTENNWSARLQIDLQPVTDSTNQRLLELSGDDLHQRVCLAEYQTAGRGRHGRRWVVPYALGLSLSLAWSLPVSIEKRQLLSLVPGVALMRVLKNTGLAQQAGLKWPNDLVCMGRKLAGVLTETLPECTGQQSVIFGIGMNIYNARHAAMMSEVQQPWLTLSDLVDNEQLSRNKITASLISELVKILLAVEKEGLAPILQEWRVYDLSCDQRVKLIWPDHEVHGVARGITDEGALKLEVDGQLREFASGELSLRLMGNTG